MPVTFRKQSAYHPAQKLAGNVEAWTAQAFALALIGNDGTSDPARLV
jgi:hypothetical protein